MVSSSTTSSSSITARLFFSDLCNYFEIEYLDPEFIKDFRNMFINIFIESDTPYISNITENIYRSISKYQTPSNTIFNLRFDFDVWKNDQITTEFTDSINQKLANKVYNFSQPSN